MLPPATRLGPYEVLAPLGAGGMGEVYRARDPRLNREVAIKVLPADVRLDEDRRARFDREARAVAALSHPNVVAIYDVGADGHHVYAVMELLEGETLGARLRREPLPVRRAVEIGAAIAEGLAAAHQRGIVHRDLKPDNVFLTSDGRVKLLDFGLARVSLPGVSSDLTTIADATAPGIALGTVGYMSPEQVRGEAVDARADVFALGCLLSEMLSGRPAFVRATAAETFSAILHGEPVGLADASAPRSLVALVEKCLAKAPGDRFQGTADLPFAIRSTITTDAPPASAPSRPSRRLWWVAAVALIVLAAAAYWLRPASDAGAPITSLAVLPFENIGGDPAMEYLSDGLADHVINSLTAAQPGKLRVRPFASVVRFRTRPIDTATVAAALNVDALVIGSVRQQGEDLAISVSLVDAREDAQIWGNRYTSRLADILAVQDRFASDVASTLRLQLTDEEATRLVRRDTNDPEAYLLYRQGMHELNRFSAEGLMAARDLFQRAAQRDPRYAAALAGVARTYVLLGSIHVGPRAAYPEALRALERVRALDPDNPELRVQQGVIHLFHDWNWVEAERELDPSMPDGSELLIPVWNMHGFLLGARGRTQEGIEAIQRGNEVEPLSAPRRAELAQAWLWEGDTARASAEARRALELNPYFFLAHHHLGVAQVLEGRFDEAIATFEKGLTTAPQSALLRGGVALAHARAGRRATAESILDEMENWSPRSGRAYAVAWVHAALGRPDAALAWLRRSAEDRDPFFIWVRSDPLFATLSKDPRFAALIREVGLPS